MSAFWWNFYVPRPQSETGIESKLSPLLKLYDLDQLEPTQFPYRQRILPRYLLLVLVVVLTLVYDGSFFWTYLATELTLVIFRVVGQSLLNTLSVILYNTVCVFRYSFIYWSFAVTGQFLPLTSS